MAVDPNRFAVYMPDWQKTWDEGVERGNAKAAQREARGYLAEDNLSGAAQAYQARGYLQPAQQIREMQEARESKALRKDVGALYAKGDYAAGLKRSAEAGDLQTAGVFQQQIKRANEEQLEAANRLYQEMYADMVFLSGLPVEQQQAGYDGVKQKYAGRGLPIDRLPQQWGPMVQRGLMAQLEGPAKLVQMELDARKAAIAEGKAEQDARRADAAMMTAQAAMIRAERAGSENSGGRMISAEEAAAMGLPQGAYWQEPGKRPVKISGPQQFGEGERLAASFAVRMDDSVNTIQRAVNSGTVDWGLVYAPDWMAGGANADTKAVRRSVRDFINAQLRRESGAAIGQDEFVSARLQYIPAPGDPPSAVAGKLAAMARARDLMRFQGGGAYEALTQNQAPATDQNIQAGERAGAIQLSPEDQALIDKYSTRR